MASNVRRGVVELTVMYEWLLWRVVVEVNVNVHGGYNYRWGGDNDCKNDNEDENEGNNGNEGGGVRVKTKMCTAIMDVWAKSQRLPPFWFGGAG